MRKRDLDAGSGLRKLVIVIVLVAVGLYFALLDWTAPQLQRWIGEHRTEKWAPPAQYALAASCYYVGNLDMAIDMYRGALNRFPGSDKAVKARFRIAQCLERQEKLQEAVRSYESFRERHPSHRLSEAAKDRIDSLGYLIRTRARN